MHPNERSRGKRPWIWAACVGLILFTMIQIIPIALSSDTGDGRALSRSQAKQKALGIAGQRFGISADAVQSVLLVHMSNSPAVGYFSKEDLLSRYQKEWEPDYPTDVYRADLVLGGNQGTLTLLLKMETGKLVGWRSTGIDQTAAHAGQPAQTPQQMARTALSYASFFGIRKADWKWDGQQPGDSRPFTFYSNKKPLAAAKLRLDVQMPSDYSPLSSRFPSWQGGAVNYRIDLPDSFTAYLAEQTKLAGRLNALGFVVPQLILLVLAIVYAATRREHTSFRRGIWFALLFFVLYLAFTFNMIPGFRAQMLQEGLPADDPVLSGMIAANLVVLAGMAAFTYFAAVGGDGLWRSMGRDLWPRWRERGFGEAVVASMKQGYLLALILLGAQSVILLGLEKGIGMFQASDATQSTYNMTYPWLLLLLAWCAGISEEVQSRFFGIALFRSWLISAAKKLLGREPGQRATAIVTGIAMLPPGLFWAFGHVGYAVYPAYSRLIELILMGLLFGWFMLRFGLMAVIFAHVTLDSVLMGTQMVFDGLPGDLPAGLLGLFMPAVAAYLIWWTHSRSRWGADRLRPTG